MTPSDILTLVSLVGGALIALAGQAIGLIVYWNGQLSAERDAFAKSLADLRTDLEAKMNKQGADHDTAVNLLHSRISTARKEMVLGEQYQRDLAELKQGHREIIAAIERSAETMRARVREGEAMDIRLDERVKRVEGVMDRRQAGAAE